MIQGRKTHNYKGGGKRCKEETHHVPRGALSSGPASMICHYICISNLAMVAKKRERKDEFTNSNQCFKFQKTYITVKCKSPCKHDGSIPFSL